jgi:hypothetical protein
VQPVPTLPGNIRSLGLITNVRAGLRARPSVRKACIAVVDWVLNCYVFYDRFGME